MHCCHCIGLDDAIGKQEVMTRPKFKTRPIFLRTEQQREIIINLVKSLPLDEIKPLEIVVREYRPVRKQTQSALMWAGPLKDLEEQAWLNGRTYSAAVWHQHAKEQFLPEEYSEDLTREGYLKWGFKPNGERFLIGSTTDLTVHGFALYLEQVYAFGASLGVDFHANPNERSQ